MSESKVVAVAVGVLVRLPLAVLESHTAASPRLVGEELARGVDAYVRRARLGYYPPLGYCDDLGVLSGDLVEAVHNMAWLSRELVREEVVRRLGQAFPRVGVDRMHSTAFTMPRVRVGQPNAVPALTRHFTPDSVRVGLTVDLKRSPADAGESARYVRQQLARWLADRFSTVEVTSSQVV